MPPVNVMHIIEDLENGGAERVLVTLSTGAPTYTVSEPGSGVALGADASA